MTKKDREMTTLTRKMSSNDAETTMKQRETQPRPTRHTIVRFECVRPCVSCGEGSDRRQGAIDDSIRVKESMACRRWMPLEYFCYASGKDTVQNAA